MSRVASIAAAARPLRRLCQRAALILGALALPATAQSPAALAPKPPAPLAAAPASGGPVIGAAPVSLNAADVNAWLDGYLPYAIDAGGIAGAVIVIVKDGQVITSRGYGHSDMRTRKPVDPSRTLFRPGSVSKLFGWTAVMQQVQAGKLDLDRDINDYLDFKIPQTHGKPITLRHIMTHTAGFEETAKYLIVEDASGKRALGDILKHWIPDRIYAPGTMPAYSNYGASLAGYIVQRVSGERFEDYVQRHIFAPLNMKHSSFEQPLPPRLAAMMSKGYDVASGKPRPYEIIEMSPAGALASTGDDMGRFMLGFLDDRGALISPEIRTQMFANVNRPLPGLPAMALGFYHEDRNGLTIVGHGGDTNWFHSDLHLIVDKGVGIYMSFNSGGKDGAAQVIRTRLFHQFLDRYFPDNAIEPKTIATAKAHGQALTGHYFSSRASSGNWINLIELLGQVKVLLNEDDTISVSALRDPAGVPKRWREVAPWQWREVGGSSLLAAEVKDGRVTKFSIGEFAPIFVFLPATGGFDAGWILPITVITLLVMLLTALAWPVTALLRRTYGYRSPVVGRALSLDRAMRGTAWIALLVAGGWLGIIAAFMTDAGALDGRLDIWMRLLQLLSIVGIAGVLLSAYTAYHVVRSSDRRLVAKVWAVLFVLAGLFLAWFVVRMGLITFSLDY